MLRRSPENSWPDSSAVSRRFCPLANFRDGAPSALSLTGFQPVPFTHERSQPDPAMAVVPKRLLTVRSVLSPSGSDSRLYDAVPFMVLPDAHRGRRFVVDRRFRQS